MNLKISKIINMITSIQTKNGHVFINNQEIIFETLKNENYSLFLEFDTGSEIEEFLAVFQKKYPDTMCITSSAYQVKETFNVTFLNDENSCQSLNLEKMPGNYFINLHQIIVSFPDMQNDGTLAKLDIILRAKLSSSELFGCCRMIFIDTKAEEYVKFYSNMMI